MPSGFDLSSGCFQRLTRRGRKGGLRVIPGRETAPSAFGTDSGPPARFQGYFEHLELELMAEAGLSPDQILVSATSRAANCLGLEQV